ncbi:MAG: hypothetical protein LBF91_03200, partial [Azoarcus sp.]|nr:hypothetical protein [Azoarcus sp.]
CLIEGSFTILGKATKLKDCMQSSPREDEAGFKKSCEELANTTAALGGSPGKITYLKQCEKPAQGICKNFLGSGRDAYHYARTPKSLRTLPASCAHARGTWVSGD